MTVPPETTAVPTYLTLDEAIARLPDKPSTSTVWRWHARGVDGVHLRAIKLGKSLFTGRDWIAYFLRDLDREQNVGREETAAEVA